MDKGSFERVKNVHIKSEQKGKEDQEIRTRIAEEIVKYGMLRLLIWPKFISRKNKERIYRTVIKATVVYMYMWDVASGEIWKEKIGTMREENLWRNQNKGWLEKKN